MTSRTTKNHGGPLKSPSLVVCHYSVSGSLSGTIDWLCDPRSKASYHLLVDRDGTVAPLVPTSTVAWHAGASSWRGRAGVNSFSIGVCCINWGPLKPAPDGTFRPLTGTEVIQPADVFHGRHSKSSVAYEHWQRFPEPQIAALDNLIGELFAEFCSLTEAVNHSDVAPLRKVDCGPSFDAHMAAIQTKYNR